ncbi:hypothetical protein B0H14DRAFT_2645533 [Mycena olivaceomarginata]|nr:hypothetical protein B0H14DRAFT_2645533 [Mycena olivaceomarginata]
MIPFLEAPASCSCRKKQKAQYLGPKVAFWGNMTSVEEAEARITCFETEIEELWPGVLAAISQQAVECVQTELDYFRYLCELIQLVNEAEAEVEIVQRNMRVIEDELWEATVHHDQALDLCQHYNVLDEALRADNESSDGVASEGTEKVRRKRKGKGH